WKVWGTGPCSVTCNLGVAPRTVACVQSVRGRESAVHDVECQAAVKPASMVPCLCTASCGYGIQSRAVSCMGPSSPVPLTPLLCMHMPKPITIQGCNRGACAAYTEPAANPTPTPSALTAAAASPSIAVRTVAPPTTEDPLPPATPNTTAAAPSAVQTPRLCGRLLLEESGTVDLRHVGRRCMVAIGRPLDEVIHIQVESAALKCQQGEFVAFFDRLAFVRKCGQLRGVELTTRTNMLLLRQVLLGPGSGVLLSYTSQKNSKTSHHQDCDIQLFSSSGVFENPTTASTNHTCRVLINAPPSVKIQIQA
ncbi:hypothetical protein CRUP_037393, partial [Coryphaenoides rupestris]